MIEYPQISCLLKVIGGCSSIKSFNKVHAKLITLGIVDDISVIEKFISSLISSRCSLHALCLLKHSPKLLSCFLVNTVVADYTSSKKPKEAFLFFKLAVSDGFVPDRYTFPTVLKSCAKNSGIKEAKQVHGVVYKLGFESDLYVQNSLLHVYGVCGECDGALKLFNGMAVKDVVSWSGLLSGHVRGGLFWEAICLFLDMDVKPNLATFVSVLSSCGRLGYLGMGKGIHGLIHKSQPEMNIILGNAILDMYVKCECLDEAKLVFEELPVKDSVSWTTLVSGLVQCKRPKEALEVFHCMQESGVVLDKIILATVLSACASTGALECGRWIHKYIDREGIEWDSHIGAGMVDMYAKCGCIGMVFCTFNLVCDKNIFIWNALIGGLAMHGLGMEALDCYMQMLGEGFKPNEVTFLAVLTACCHSGLVEEGVRYFDQMPKLYNIVTQIEHYGCMVDLLGRAGHLNEALNLIRSMPMKADARMLGAILSAFKAHGDVNLSQKILDDLLELESIESGNYVLLSNIYAANKRWEDVTRVRRVMNERGVQKVAGSSSIELDGWTHEFLVGRCTDHPQRQEIHFILGSLMKLVKVEVQVLIQG